MSRKAPIRPEQGSYVQFQLQAGQNKPPYRRDKDILAKLKDSIPQDEAQWQQARQLNGYATTEDVLQTTKDILENRIAKQELRNFICIATCCVNWHLGQKTKAYNTFKSQISSATELTIQKYMSSVRGMVQLLDPVYLTGLRHRAFEGVLLYARIGPSFLTYYNKDVAEFNTCFSAPLCLGPEVQASLPLSLAFIIKYRHTEEYSYTDICDALGTYVLDETAYAKFVLTLENGKPVPCVLPYPEEAEDIRPNRHDSSSIDLEQADVAPEHSPTGETFQLPTTFKIDFKVFATSEALQQKVKQLQEQGQITILPVISNAPLKELQWTPRHEIAANQLVDDLIEDGTLPRKSLRRYKSSYQHDPGSVAVPTGWIKIILPCCIAGEVGPVSIRGPDIETSIEWTNCHGFVLGEHMLFFTLKTLFYISVSIPVSQDERHEK
ncbi:hypothetical protein FPOAC2_00028 [Fusarium poae]|uniref:Uncharacterized protein n=1 Tax=Fusarium poae TaxID=36050 RepID=A0A1B8B001_FUSPO|nr:hypothetical protein FPOAC1_000017 [Fusarium poae]KAG8674054.1 hypothetical protein FPOAC1_000017 [Fusarium poae]OBS26075.1 hypothetical protein FPOA_00019 [Fusarium poae]